MIWKIDKAFKNIRTTLFFFLLEQAFFIEYIQRNINSIDEKLTKFLFYWIIDKIIAEYWI